MGSRLRGSQEVAPLRVDRFTSKWIVWEYDFRRSKRTGLGARHGMWEEVQQQMEYLNLT